MSGGRREGVEKTEDVSRRTMGRRWHEEEPRVELRLQEGHGSLLNYVRGIIWLWPSRVLLSCSDRWIINKYISAIDSRLINDDLFGGLSPIRPPVVAVAFHYYLSHHVLVLRVFPLPFYYVAFYFFMYIILFWSRPSDSLEIHTYREVLPIYIYILHSRNAILQQTKRVIFYYNYLFIINF